MAEIVHCKAIDVPCEHIASHEGYEYNKRLLIPQDYAKQCSIKMIEIPPGKSAYPYHYHLKNEEFFYILQGTGLLKTPQGLREVSAGEYLFFPTGEKGAHKLTNSSDTEMLVYLDFDTKNNLDVAFYPDSNKVGIYGDGVRQLYKTEDQVDYYEGE